MDHKDKLKQHCRVCGRKLYKAKAKPKDKVSHIAFDHHSDIRATFAIDVGEDNADVHPPNLCHPCFLAMKRSITAGGIPYRCAVAPFEWQAHTDTEDCKVSIHTLPHNICTRLEGN